MNIDELKLLAGQDINLSPSIIIHHPKLSEIMEIGEDRYYGIITSLCATPSDYKSVLYDKYGIDYEEVEEFEFFLMMWTAMKDEDISIIIPNTKASDYKIETDQNTGRMFLHNENTGAIINEVVYATMVDYLRKFHGFTKHVDKAGNETTKKYLIKKARKELERRMREDKHDPMLAPLVSSMVNCEAFKYDHFTVWDLTIYQFMDSVKRIQKLRSVDQIMTGIYTGNIDPKKMSQDSMNWLGTLD